MSTFENIDDFNNYVNKTFFNNGDKKDVIENFIQINKPVNEAIVISYVPKKLRKQLQNKSYMIYTVDLLELEKDANEELFKYINIYKRVIKSKICYLYLIEYPHENDINVSDRTFIFQTLDSKLI